MTVDSIVMLLVFVLGCLCGYMIRELKIIDTHRLHVKLLELENERLKAELEALKYANSKHQSDR